MTDQSPAQETRAVATIKGGGNVVAIIPQSVEEMYRIAGAYAASGLAPTTLKTKEQVFIAMMAGAELGLPPNQAVQSFYVVNNRPTLWGDAIPAILWANGFKIKEWATGTIEAKTYCAHCEITRPGGDVIPGEFSWADAEAAMLLQKTGPWTTAKKRMFKMRARAFAARDGASDILKGFQIREEQEDIEPTREAGRPVTSGIVDRLRQHGHGMADGFKESAVDDGLGIKQNPATAEQVAETAAEAEFTEVEPCTHEWKAEEDEPDCLICDKCGGVHDLAAGPAPTVGDDVAVPVQTENDSETTRSESEASPSEAQGKAGDDLFPGDDAAGGFKTETEPDPDPEDWAIAFNGRLDACRTDEEVAILLADPEGVAGFERLAKEKPAMATALNGAIGAKRSALTKGKR